MEFPAHRKLISIPQPDASKEQSTSDSSFKFRVMSYNMLAQGAIRREIFSWCSAECLKWNNRRQRLLRELTESNADIICAQEMDWNFYDNFWNPSMSKLGYKSRFKAKTMLTKAGTPNLNTYGCAIFYRESRFEELYYEEINFDDLAIGLEEPEVEEMDKPNVGQILVLGIRTESNENQSTPQSGLIVSNCHLFWNLNYEWTRMRQADLLLRKTSNVRSSNPQFSSYPLISCSDLNSAPDTIIYAFVTNRFNFPFEKEMNRFLPPLHTSNNLIEIVSNSMSGEREKTMYSRKIETEAEKRRIEDAVKLLEEAKSLPLMESVYRNYCDLVPSAVPSKFWTGEPPYTNYTTWKGTLDYIMTEKLKDENERKLKAVAIMEIPTPEVLSSKPDAFLPNDVFPSDHVSIFCDFTLAL